MIKLKLAEREVRVIRIKTIHQNEISIIYPSLLVLVLLQLSEENDESNENIENIQKQFLKESSAQTENGEKEVERYQGVSKVVFITTEGLFDDQLSIEN